MRSRLVPKLVTLADLELVYVHGILCKAPTSHFWEAATAKLMKIVDPLSETKM